MNIYLVRHGQSVGNVNMICYGHTDYPLTEQGEQDAIQVGEKLKAESFDICWTSLLCRAQRTAELCSAGHGAETVATGLLNEQFMGEFEDIPFDRLLKQYPEEAMAMIKDWSANPPLGGESFDQLYDRVAQAGQMILDDGRDCLVVAHNGSLGALLTWLLGLPKSAAMSFRFEHGCYSRIRTSARCNYLELFNR